ncbi:MAG: 4Fe-4S binding protein [Kiritimatiellae bacterium]|nr:4Fe-4S binding protein [Kiritimatiellia bacterium]
MQQSRCPYAGGPGVLDVGKMRAAGLYPGDERIASGPVAVLECVQDIPCNPCEKACRKGFIAIGARMTGMPKLDPRCTGCGLCVTRCPGLAIFVLDATYSETEATVTLPYELIPLPEPGEKVLGVDRRGRAVCEGTIVAVRQMRKDDTCRALTVAVPKRFIHEVRHVRVAGSAASGIPEPRMKTNEH